MKIEFTEQELRDAVFVLAGHELNRSPETIDNVDLSNTLERGFYAEAKAGRIKLDFTQADIEKAVRHYLDSWHNFNVGSSAVQLKYSPASGYGAVIEF
jgi:hypothetical protein